ncbi:MULTISPECIES: YoaK family protein [unclassified Streptomyces]|uniref:YoaK family protein n=1 Tax=unclassified Streptomyces TaxID=2593676 RepID=UPI00378DF146
MPTAPPAPPPSPPSSPSSAAPRAGDAPWRGEGALLLLSAASGAADAFVFLCVGQVFAGVMTGNLVLLGASAAGAGEDGVALKVAVALGAYFCGVAAGALLTGSRGPRVALLLGTEVVLLGAAAVLWGLELVSTYGDRLGVLALVALAMGVQGRVRVTPTNYFTGTLTSLAGRFALRELRGGDGWVLGRLAAVVAGAAVAALTERWWSPGAALGAVVLAAGALVLETAPRREGLFRPGKGKPRPDRGNPAGAA